MKKILLGIACLLAYTLSIKAQLLYGLTPNGLIEGAGVINELIIKPGAGHGWRDTQPEEKRFTEWFDKYLK